MKKALLVLLALAPIPAFSEPKTLSTQLFKSELEVMEVFATHLGSYTSDGMFKLSIKASELIYSAGHMQPPPKDEFGTLWCTNAAQSLRNYIDDMRLEPLDRQSALAQMADYRSYKKKCLKALKKG